MISRILKTQKTQNLSCEFNRNYQLLFEKFNQKHLNFDVYFIINFSIIVQLNQRLSQLVTKLEIISFAKISRSMYSKQLMRLDN